MVRCVRAVVGGVRGWRVTWLDYDKKGWRQNAYFTSEAEARAFAEKQRKR